MSNIDEYGCIDNNNNLTADNLRCQIENKNLLQELGSVYLMSVIDEDHCSTQEYKLGENGKLFSPVNYKFAEHFGGSFENTKVRFTKQIGTDPSTRYFFDNLTKNNITLTYIEGEGSNLPYDFNFISDSDNNSMFTYFFYVTVTDNNSEVYTFNFPTFSFLNSSKANYRSNIVGNGVKNNNQVFSHPEHSLKCVIDVANDRILGLKIYKSYINGEWTDSGFAPGPYYPTVNMTIIRIK